MLSTILWLRLLGRLNRLGIPRGGGDVKDDDAAVVGTTDLGGRMALVWWEWSC